jgi:glucosamine--fructose-6-phosphate aminotransferase (isomerizing)
MRVDRDVELKWENMYRGILAQVEWLKHGPDTLFAHASHMLSTVPPRIYLVGCGDSHYAGLATRLAFEHWTGIPTEALESLEFSRYVVDYAPPGSWVVCVSNSGRVSRTVECALFAQQHGLFPIAVTFNEDSPLAKASSVTLPFGYTDVGFGPGTLSYIASLVSLYTVALRAAELSGKQDNTASANWLEAIRQQSEFMAATIASYEPEAAAFGQKCDVLTPVHIIGAGPNYGTALFGMAKMIEAARISAVGQELEEWAHEQYFCTGPGTVTIVIAPLGASIGRAREQLQAVRDMHGTAIAICSPDDSETRRMADVVFPVSGSQNEMLTPLSYCIPLELFAYHFASSKGLTMLGFDDSTRMEVNFRQIFGSEIALGSAPAP